MDTLDKIKLLEKTERLMRSVQEDETDSWIVAQHVIQDFTNVDGKKFTLKVVIEPCKEIHDEDIVSVIYH